VSAPQTGWVAAKFNKLSALPFSRPHTCLVCSILTILTIDVISNQAPTVSLLPASGDKPQMNFYNSLKTGYNL
jgi:hypothetical protein